MKTNNKFYDRYWKARKSDRLEDFNYKWPVIKKLIPQNKVKLLDYGCGTAELLSEIRKINPKAILVGVDISSVAIKRARKKIPKIKFVKINSDEKLPFKSSSFNYIMVMDVIEHVYDTDYLVSEFKRILKKKGGLLISTPYHGLIKNLLISSIGFDKIFNPTGPHIRFFTFNSLKSLLGKYNFKIVRGGVYGRFYPLSRGMYILARKS